MFLRQSILTILFLFLLSAPAHADYAVKLYDEISSQPSGSFKANFDPRLEVQTTNHDRLPYFMARPNGQSFVKQPGHRIILSGAPTGDKTISADNFILIEIFQKNRIQRYVHGAGERIDFMGNPIPKLRPEKVSPDSLEAVFDLTNLIEACAPTRIQVTPYDFGVFGNATPAYLTFRQGSAAQTPQPNNFACVLNDGSAQPATPTHAATRPDVARPSQAVASSSQPFTPFTPFTPLRNAAQSEDATTLISRMISGIRSLYAGQSSFQGLNDQLMLDSNAAPTEFRRGNEEMGHPLFGKITVQPTDDSSGFDIFLAEVPTDTCVNLLSGSIATSVTTERITRRWTVLEAGLVPAHMQETAIQAMCNKQQPASMVLNVQQNMDIPRTRTKPASASVESMDDAIRMERERQESLRRQEQEKAAALKARQEEAARRAAMLGHIRNKLEAEELAREQSGQ